ncbi:radical SAM:Molybdenum cofactor synthesis C-terminal [Stigmatella aurantiaca DW4/3-1]|uniref:Radical SAM:Molybdenum cofactor synthesis C-terminal n=1 Tax=Stigmatella aurantiaca (strain DW4/3-1) TaxID=378806 RepID=Q095T8_STIAD|nr:radical SAM:Molybdenum cofactor synthesis C-terminal [Stigmatella aurantiaca DW4/3-1]
MTPAMLPLASSRDPLAPPLLDAQGRRMTYLRLSVTDRCNFRCTYCSPASWGGKKDLLSALEFERIVSVFASMGIQRVRLTGGEPLIRPDILEIAQRLSALPGVERVAITTNASHLERLAVPLREAGVSQLNISLDTLSAETFRRISKQGDFASTLRGIDAAAAAGFASLKLNVVVMRGVNDGEAAALVEYAHARGLTPTLHRADAVRSGRARSHRRADRAAPGLRPAAGGGARGGAHPGEHLGACALLARAGGARGLHLPADPELLRRVQPGPGGLQRRPAQLSGRARASPSAPAHPRRGLGHGAGAGHPSGPGRQARGPPLHRDRQRRHAPTDDGHWRLRGWTTSPAGRWPGSGTSPRCSP